MPSTKQTRVNEPQFQVLWGPLCLLVAYFTTVDHPLKHPLRVIVCLAHLYGATLYYATSLYNTYFNGISHSRPEVLYFWVYYFLMNFVWIVIPACKYCLLQERDHVLIGIALRSSLQQRPSYFLCHGKVRQGSGRKEDTIIIVSCLIDNLWPALRSSGAYRG